MAWPTIAKGSPRQAPQLSDYDRVRTDFRWDDAFCELGGQADSLNMAFEAVDRHVADGHGERVALRLLLRQGRIRLVTYGELKDLSDRCAAMLRGAGLLPGGTVALLLGRGLEFAVAALGALKAGGVVCPLFPVLGPEPIRSRLTLGGATILVTTPELYERKISSMRHLLPELRAVFAAVPEGSPVTAPGMIDFHATLALAPADAGLPQTDAATPALLHYTSGTTGVPKGAVHNHGAIAGQRLTARLVLDLTPEDVFWCTADPGWVTGTVYGLLAPLAVGCSLVIDPEGFDAGRWYSILNGQQVSVFYTTPTAIRLLMRFGAALARTYRFPDLRMAASVGEPLNPEAVAWGREALGVPFHDTWWQTETGCITIANFPALPIRPGSMGLPVPGVEVALVERVAGEVRVLAAPGMVGEIAVRPDGPSMFTGYLGEPKRTAECFADGWYLTGDLARCDSDGRFWFAGRKDDVIKSAGHLIGPFEVEGTLMDHPAVAEAGVIGRPDPMMHEVVIAFVTLNPGFVEGEALRRELLAFARDQLGPALAPRDIQFVRDLPKTNSGKIMRRVLRQQDRGLSAGEAVPVAG